MKSYLKFIYIFLAVTGFSFINPPRKLRVFLIGDSTMSDKQTDAYPETGWGTMFAKFFDTSKTVVYNRAQNSQVAGSFLKVNQWAPVLDSPDHSKLLFNISEPGANPQFPNGVNDNTHFSEYGARLIAELVLDEMKKLNLELLNGVVKPVAKTAM